MPFKGLISIQYQDPDVVSKIKEASGDAIRAAFDTHSEEASQILTAHIIAPSGGKVITLLPVSEVAASLRPEVIIQSEFSQVHYYPYISSTSPDTWLYSAFGVPWSLFGVTYTAALEDKLQISNFLANELPVFVREGKLLPPKINLWENGLDDLGEAMDYMLAGKVSAEKIVLRIPNQTSVRRE